MNLLTLQAIIRVSGGILSDQPLHHLQRSGRTRDDTGEGIKFGCSCQGFIYIKDA